MLARVLGCRWARKADVAAVVAGNGCSGDRRRDVLVSHQGADVETQSRADRHDIFVLEPFEDGRLACVVQATNRQL
jgi:hypothetical protein